MNSFADSTTRPALSVMPTVTKAPAIAGGVLGQRRPGWLVRFLNRMARWQTNARQRRALLHLAPHVMKDIGVSEADIWQEVMKPFWRD